MEFEIVKKGYKPQAVNDYIKRQQLDFESRSAEQRDRIFELKARAAQLEKENAELRARESEVSRALLSAVQKSSEMEETAKKKYDLEIQRLKLFHIKWESYFDEIIARYPLSNELNSIADFTGEMRGILGMPETPKARPSAPRAKIPDARLQSGREKERLSKKDGPAAPWQAIHGYLGANAEKAKSEKTAAKNMGSPAFTMEEQLNPAEGLEDILKELGIG